VSPQPGAAKIELYDLTIHEAASRLARREISAVELTGAVLARVDAVEPRVEAYVTVTRERALEDARAADARLGAGESGPLTGIPVCIKDVLCTQGIRTTCGSRMLESFVPPYDATVVARLRAAGAVLVGKGNMDEFAMGSSTENSAFHPTHNPWDLARVPGGSSGGSAAAVAAGEALFSLGSDTGGSIRQPASLCGVVGVKPTYGRVSRFGLVAFASSLDQVGPFTHDVRDAALVLNAISGHDAQDSTSAPVDVPDFTAALNGDVKGLRIGVPREYFVEGMEQGVRDAVEAALREFERLGAHVDDEVSLPSTPHALAVYYIIAPSEASANLARYDGVKYGFADRAGSTMWEDMERTRQYGFGDEVKRRIMLGTYALSSGYYDAYYLKAQKVRTLIRREFDAAFERCDVLLAPTSPTTAFRIGERVDDPLQMYLSDVCTLPINIAGVPGLSVPAGFADGLPVGLQVIAKPFAEATMLRAAYAYEQATGWSNRRPAL
jgi:aspartyl-tRNA(Asn)/glutamyl-tRNA(Gln) amidotransferase subunit A